MEATSVKRRALQKKILIFLNCSRMPSTVLVTGGCGYIGSHVCVLLLQAGYHVVIVDNLSNADHTIVSKIEKIAQKKVKFFCLDICDTDALGFVFEAHEIDAVIHMAGVKSVAESIRDPIKYFRINVSGTASLLHVMKQHNVSDLIFSSSATVYGDVPVPDDGLREDGECGATQNPYGKSKQIVEAMLENCRDILNVRILRYFNPLGAHPSGVLGDRSQDNLMPKLLNAAIHHRPFHVFGSDYATPDGTPIRDYIHVMDLARGHLSALQEMEDFIGCDCKIFNLGSGHGYSVLQVLKAWNETNPTHPVQHVVSERREGDLPVSYANCEKAHSQLNFQCQYTLADMCRDHYRSMSSD